MRSRVISEGAEIAGDHVVEVAVTLGEVEAVAEHEVVFDLESGAPRRGGNDPPHRLVEEGAHFQPAGLAAAKLAEDVGEGEAGVDDVLDEDDVPAADVELEILDDTDTTGPLGVVRDGQKVELGQDGQVPDQVGEKRHA